MLITLHNIVKIIQLIKVCLIQSVYLILLWVKREKSKHYIVGGICIQRSCSCNCIDIRVNHTGSAEWCVRTFLTLRRLSLLCYQCLLLSLRYSLLQRITAGWIILWGILVHNRTAAWWIAILFLMDRLDSVSQITEWIPEAIGLPERGRMWNSYRTDKVPRNILAWIPLRSGWNILSRT